ncbi:MAG: VOC family protein [Micrococcales bacterium]|nr:VOC family protein [Micrococcales bacterium]
MATLNPYLNFRGQAREAIEFYRSVFGGELTVSTFREFGMPVDAGVEDQVMHAQLETPGGFTLMCSDVPPSMEVTPGTNVQVSLSGGGSDAEALAGYWRALMAEGTETMPLAAAPWGARFGQGIDRFGIGWLVNIGD